MLQQFAINLASNMLVPMIVLSAITVGVLIYGFKIRAKYEYGTDARAQHAEWWQNTFVQLTVLGWVAYVITGSVPPPDYNVKVVKTIKMITSVKTKTETFASAYSLCKDALTEYDNGLTDAQKQMCYTTAMLNTNPKMNTMKVVRYRVDPYSELFNRCVGSYNVDGYDPMQGVARTENCHKKALEVRRSVGLGK